MARRLAQGWVWLAILLPAVIGLTMLFNPAAVPAGTTFDSLLNIFAFRNLALSLTLLLALFTQSKRVVAFLLIARGLTDLGDFLATAMALGYVSGSELFPLVSAVVTFIVAYFFYTWDSRRPVAQPGGAL